MCTKFLIEPDIRNTWCVITYNDDDDGSYSNYHSNLRKMIIKNDINKWYIILTKTNIHDSNK